MIKIRPFLITEDNRCKRLQLAIMSSLNINFITLNYLANDCNISVSSARV